MVLYKIFLVLICCGLFISTASAVPCTANIPNGTVEKSSGHDLTLSGEDTDCQIQAGSPAVSPEDLKVILPVGVAPMNPEYLRALEKYQAMETSGSATVSGISEAGTYHATGGLPPVADQSYLSGPFVIEETGSYGTIVKSPLYGGISYPVSYDLRSVNKVTPIKNQGLAGVCWAFSSIASLESSLLPGEPTTDFSENNMKNLLSSSYPEGYDRAHDAQGNNWYAIAYLSRWTGPVNEADDPYNATSGISPTDKPVRKHVQNVYFIPDRIPGSSDNSNLKTAILNYGVVSTFMYINDSPSYWNEANHSYYYSGSNAGNHLVGIVGWNDSYDKNRFAPNIPPGDGAFIIKNSWGTGWGDNGYFMISYYDSRIGRNSAVFTAESSQNYDHIYQYDPLGMVNQFYIDGMGSGWIANVFTSTRNENLSAVSFYTTDVNTAYEVYVYKNPNSGPVLNSSGNAWSQKSTFGNAGYHTVPVSPGISLKPGDKFSVVVKLTNPSYKYYAALEMPYASWYSTKATAHPNESYHSSNGISWADLTLDYPDTNACIKAFTKDTNAADRVGVIRNNKTWILDASGNGAYGAGDVVYNYGIVGDVYITGDWNGNGTTKIGLVRNNNTWLLDASGNGLFGPGDLQYTFGKAGDVYVTGDWNGNGTTKIGVVRFNTTWLLDASGDGKFGPGDYQYVYGRAGDRYVTGDWNNDRKTEIGVVRNNKTWILDASGNGVYGAGDIVYNYGIVGDRFVTGDWNGNGTTRIGVVRFNTTWLLDASGNGLWSPGDYQYVYGRAGDRYVTGKWK